MVVDWNGKAVQYGGGGFNGVLITGARPLRDDPVDASRPLTRGYATFGTDSGHQASASPPTELAAFALNDEALANFAYASYKKVRNTAQAVMRGFYGRPAAHVYYFGGSEGGREGLTMAQRFPDDYDGIVSVVPVINWVGLMHAHDLQLVCPGLATLAGQPRRPFRSGRPRRPAERPAGDWAVPGGPDTHPLRGLLAEEIGGFRRPPGCDYEPVRRRP